MGHTYFRTIKGSINKILKDKHLLLNGLAFISIAIAFLYNFLMARIFGLTKEMDLYFATYTFILYTGYFSQIFYESFVAFYAELKVEDTSKADRLYATLINQTFLFTLFIVLILQIVSPFIAKFFLLSPDAVFLVRILAYFLILQNLYMINKNILNLNFKFTVAYACEISVFVMNIALIYVSHRSMGIYAIVFSLLTSYFLVLVFQFFYIRLVIKTKFSFSIWHEKTLQIVSGSVFLKLGSLLYGFKDVFMGNILLQAGTGVFSTYSYALKFATAVHSIINAPNLTVFSSETNYQVSSKQFDLIQPRIKNIIKKLLLMFSACACILYFAIPVITQQFMQVDSASTSSIQRYFVLLCGFYCIVILDAPFLTVMHAFKKFPYSLFTNAVFCGVFILFAKVVPLKAEFIILSLALAQLVNFVLHYLFTNQLLKKLADKKYPVA